MATRGPQISLVAAVSHKTNQIVGQPGMSDGNSGNLIPRVLRFLWDPGGGELVAVLRDAGGGMGGHHWGDHFGGVKIEYGVPPFHSAYSHLPVGGDGPNDPHPPPVTNNLFDATTLGGGPS